MIITIPAIKDTYITNLVTPFNDGKKANVGTAATLDLFKLHNENRNAFSEAVIQFLDGVVLNENDVFTFIDSKETEVKIIVETGSETSDGSTKEFNNSQHVIFGIQNLVFDQIAERLKSVINNINLNENNGLSIDIEAFSNSNSEIILRQKTAGEKGDTNFFIPDSDFIVVNSNSQKKFARKDKSCILIKFDIESFIKNFDTENNLNFDASAFNNLTAKIVLKDVTSGHVKPKDFKLSTFKLLKEFNEGIGKDTINFSGLNKVASFVSLNQTEDWEVAGHLTKTIEIDANAIDSEVFLAGDENLEIETTNYVKGIIRDNDSNFGHLIQIKEEFLKDSHTYFVKRFGSRHLINKSLVPILKIKIPDSDFGIPKQSPTVRYLNSIEKFYVFNKSSQGLSDFPTINGYTLKFRILNEDKSVTLIENKDVTDVVNYRGQTVLGIKKSEINSTELSQFDSNIKDLIRENKVVLCTSWYFVNDNDANDIKILKEENNTFFVSSSNKLNGSDNIVSRISFENKEIKSSDDSITSCDVYFLDSKENLDAVNVPVQLISKNLGDVNYQITNLENNEILLDFNEDENLFYDGIKYNLNLHMPKIYENFLLGFKFKIKDTVSKDFKTILNKEVFKVK